MADADEDAIHHPPSHDSPAQLETDLSDETQDFRFLSFLTDNTQTSLPRRGEKDFEPNPTLYQADVLAASRQAMHNALAYPRLHHPRNKVVGIYAPDGPRPPSTIAVRKDFTTTTSTTVASTTSSKAQREKDDVGLANVSPDACVYVPNPKGQYFKSLGQADRWNRMWLLPEEALYLLERGSLEIWWPISLTGCVDGAKGQDVEDEEQEREEEMGVPMSLQAAYACFIGRGGLTTDRFSIFTGLKRLGYTIIRAPGWDDDDIHGKEDAGDVAHSESVLSSSGLTGVFARLLKWMYLPDSRVLPATGPLVGLGIHRTYPDIYRKLALIPWYDPMAGSSQRQHPAAPYRIFFHVYKPSTAFKKSAPPEPDFRIAVINCRTETSIPTLAQLGALLESTPLDPPRGEKMERLLYMRLRHGYRNVILGVVDQGVVSYLRVSDAAFGKEKLYEWKGAPAGNKGGRPFRPPKAKGG